MEPMKAWTRHRRHKSVRFATVATIAVAMLSLNRCSDDPVEPTPGLIGLWTYTAAPQVARHSALRGFVEMDDWRYDMDYVAMVNADATDTTIVRRWSLVQVRNTPCAACGPAPMCAPAQRQWSPRGRR